MGHPRENMTVTPETVAKNYFRFAAKTMDNKKSRNELGYIALNSRGPSRKCVRHHRKLLWNIISSLLSIVANNVEDGRQWLDL